MYYEFYIDQFFLEHLLTDFLILKSVSDYAKVKLSFRKAAAASLLDSLWVCMCICQGCPAAYPVGMLMTGLLVFSKKQILILLLFFQVWFGAVSELLSSFGLDTIWSVILTALSLPAFFRYLDRGAKTSGIVAVKLEWNTRSEKVRGLIDSGNLLKEPLTGKPVSILEEKTATDLLQKEWEMRRGCFLIPYHSIGREKGWLQGVTFDRMTVGRGKNAVTFEHPVIAIYKGQVSAEGKYQMILHPMHTDLEKKN